MNSILKKVIISLLITSGVIFLISFAFIQTVNWINYELEPKYDENGKMIYQDWIKTIRSFGNRKQFAVEKCGVTGDISWFLSDLDKNQDIDKIRFFTQSSSSPYVYTLGEKGYTKLNYETGEFTQSKNIDDFSNEDKAVLEKLEIKKNQLKKNQRNYEISWEWITS